MEDLLYILFSSTLICPPRSCLFDNSHYVEKKKLVSLDRHMFQRGLRFERGREREEKHNKGDPISLGFPY